VSYTSDIATHALREALAAQRPRSLLSIGAGSDAPFADFLDAHPQTRHTHLGEAPPAPAGLTRHDFAYVANTLELLEPAAGRALIAGLRDLVARRLYVLVALDEANEGGWDEATLLALGLTATARYAGDAQPLALYRFDLYDYKPTPDWLNPRFWANPEMWDRYRW
jgi:hypothetical protein